MDTQLQVSAIECIAANSAPNVGRQVRQSAGTLLKLGCLIGLLLAGRLAQVRSDAGASPPPHAILLR